MNLEEKKQVVAELKTGYENSPTFFLVNVGGLAVDATQGFYSGVRKAGGKTRVAKVRLIKKALSDVGLMEKASELDDVIGGQVAVVFAGQDPAAVAKGVVAFAKDSGKKEFVVGGVYKEVFMDVVKINALSKLPSYEVLMQQCASALSMPIVGVARSVNCLFENLARSVKAVAEKAA